MTLKKNKLSQKLSESSIIAKLKASFPEHIGDDAAVIDGPTQQTRYVITKDLLVEDIHFRNRYTPIKSLAHKSLHVNLSDLAAMGSLAQFVLLGIAIPSSVKDSVEAFLEYFMKGCQSLNIKLIGGDTTGSNSHFFISVTAMGIIDLSNIRYRHTAQTGDYICLAGELGEAHIGLQSLEQEKTGFENFKQKFFYPNAKIQEGIWLGKQSSVTSMMDISDGLLIDLERLCASSDKKGTLSIDYLKQETDFLEACDQLNLDPLSTVLTGGEDYGLLFTVRPSEHQQICSAFEKTFGYSIKTVGYIEEGQGVCLKKQENNLSLHFPSFLHF